VRVPENVPVVRLTVLGLREKLRVLSLEWVPVGLRDVVRV